MFWHLTEKSKEVHYDENYWCAITLSRIWDMWCLICYMSYIKEQHFCVIIWSFFKTYQYLFKPVFVLLPYSQWLTVKQRSYFNATIVRTSSGIRTASSTNQIQVSISSTFYTCIFHTKVLFSSYVLAKKALSYEKLERKMLMKLTTGVNFTKILPTAFSIEDPKSTKKHCWLDLTVFFCFRDLCA